MKLKGRTKSSKSTMGEKKGKKARDTKIKWYPLTKYYEVETRRKTRSTFEESMEIEDDRKLKSSTKTNYLPKFHEEDQLANLSPWNRRVSNERKLAPNEPPEGRGSESDQNPMTIVEANTIDVNLGKLRNETQRNQQQ